MFHVEQFVKVKKNKDDQLKSIKDFLVSGEEFSLVQNPVYGYWETNPQPPIGELPKYYESDAYISHTDSKKGALSFLYQRVKKYSLRKKQKLITQLNSGKGRLLDVGAGTGDFLRMAKEKGWDVHGVEPNGKARELARVKEIDLEASLDAVEGEQFDVVTLWHVLEHLPDLENSVRKIEKLVKPGGVLLVAVPNLNSWDARYFGKYWAAYDVPRHLWHFSQASIQNLFSSELNLEKVKPMIFDAFYVSLLSEKYRTGKSFSVKAFWLGFRSNCSAWKTGEYSSLIYCFKKAK